MNHQQNDRFLVFSSISENEEYGKLLSQITNHDEFFLIRLSEKFKPYDYGEPYEAILITLYLGDFELIPSISDFWLSNYSKKSKDWNFKIPLKQENIDTLSDVRNFNDFMKLGLIKLVDILKRRKVKNFDFQLFLDDIELI